MTSSIRTKKDMGQKAAGRSRSEVDNGHWERTKEYRVFFSHLLYVLYTRCSLKKTRGEDWPGQLEL